MSDAENKQTEQPEKLPVELEARADVEAQDAPAGTTAGGTVANGTGAANGD